MIANKKLAYFDSKGKIARLDSQSETRDLHFAYGVCELKSSGEKKAQ
jgi:hypothetical protein